MVQGAEWCKLHPLAPSRPVQGAASAPLLGVRRFISLPGLHFRLVGFIPGLNGARCKFPLRVALAPWPEAKTPLERTAFDFLRHFAIHRSREWAQLSAVWDLAEKATT